MIVQGLVYAQSPTIASISMMDGTVDSRVGISGSNFSSNPSNLEVWFGAMKGTVLQASDGFIEVSVPPGATTSAIAVTNTSTGLTGYSSDLFNLNYSGNSMALDMANQDINAFNSFEEIFDLSLCDFDLDGLNDVATTKIGTNASEIIVFQNTSSSNTLGFTILNKISNPEFDIKNPTSNVTTGDVDGDGKAELIATRSIPTANQIYVWRNISTPGNIQFASQKSYFITTGEIAKAIRLRDIDGDGKPELVVANNEANKILIFQNNSTKGNINFNGVPITITIPGAMSTNGLAVEDLNSDGKAEIITNPLFEPNVYVLENQSTKGNFIFSAPLVLNLSGNLNSLTVGDLNRDGKSDIVVTKTQESKIAVFVNNSTSAISFANAQEFDTGLRPWGLDLGDLNGDGLLDIVTTSINSDEGTYFHNKSTASVLSFDKIVVPQNLKSRNVKIGDLSGDAKPDIAVTSFDFGTNDYQLTVIRSTHCFTATILDAPESICNGQTIRINATPGLATDFVWRKDGVEVKNSTDSFLDITYPGGVYNVTAISEGASCSETSEDFTVLSGTGGIPPDIANTVTNDGPACPGESVNLSIETVAGATYLWSGPKDFTSTLQNPVLTNLAADMAGNYYATVFLGDCQSFPASTLVEVTVPPDFSIQADGPTRFCSGNSVVLSVNSETGYTYQWLKDNVAISGATSTSYTAIDDGDYSVVVSSVTLTCNIDTETITVSTYPPPTVQFSFAGVQCATNDIQFTDESNILTEFVVSYNWDFGDGNVSTLPDPVHTFATSGDYTVQLTVTYEGQDCTDSDSQIISISEPTPFTISTTGDNPFCIGESAVLTVEGSFSTYLWSTGETTASITVSEAGTYSVDVTNAAGCPSNSQIDVSTFDLPTITISADPETIMQGQSTQLEATGASSYLWSPSETLSDSTIANPEATPLETTIYSVIGTDINGCIGEASITINVDSESEELPVTAPKLFSPNGDAIDDFWVIESIENFPECQLVIFSRNGTTLLEAIPYNNDWEGVFNGEPLPEGAYYYVISCPDGRNSTGSVSIIR